MRTVLVDPITRIEGHLRIELRVEDGLIRDAYSSGGLYRGLEEILVGRHPLDAQKITSRICGVCPLAHSLAAAYCLDDALGLSAHVPPNGRLLRNLIYGANFLHNHILHFYHLALPDYLDPSLLSGSLATLGGLLAAGVPAGESRFSASETGELVAHYVEALDVRRRAHELEALFGGKMPHDMAIVPGGVTHRPGLPEVESYRFRLKEVRDFVEACYLPDVLMLVTRHRDHFALGRVGNLLTFGCFPGSDGGTGLAGRLFPAGVVRSGRVEPLDATAITECIASSWYDGDRAAVPLSGRAEPVPGRDDGYSWVKSPRYRGEPFEVGPAARLRIGLELGAAAFQKLARDLLREAGASPDDLASVAGRHLARAIEVRYLARALDWWLDALDLGAPIAVPFTIPDEAEGCGLTCAPRGALGHWVQIRNAKIRNYQVIAPTTWNASPRDGDGVPGPMERALVGTPVKGDGLVEAGRIVRSFDPCLACAVQ
jgi:hydrogenase large subunit